MPSRIPVHSFDALVLGGGLAGIAAAQRLSGAGRSVAVLEARDRLGGRLWTHHDPSSDHAIELGPEWFDSWGTIHRVLAGRHALMPEACGRHVLRTGDAWRAIDDMMDGGDRLHRKLTGISGPDRSLAQALDECCADQDLVDARHMLLRYVEGFHAADPVDLSLRWFLTVEKNQSAGDSELRAPGGLDVALDGLLRDVAASCTVYLDAPAVTVTWGRQRVRVDVETPARRQARFDAPAAIVALPLAMLARDDALPRFSPALDAKQRALDHLATGPVIKVIHVFDEMFWRDLDHVRDLSFLQDFSQPIPTWWTTNPVDAPVMVGWAAGPMATRLYRVAHDEMRELSQRSLAHALGVTAAHVRNHWRAWHYHDWQRDRWSLGAYSWARSGGAHAAEWLGQPLERTLYFAGEATAGSGYNATMDGAISSGWRAAEELLTGR
jgi:monoamine oxidase